MLGRSRRSFFVILMITAVSTLLYLHVLFTRHHDRNHSLARRQMGVVVRGNASSLFNQSFSRHHDRNHSLARRQMGVVVRGNASSLFNQSFSRHHDRNHSLARRQMGVVVRGNPSSPFNQSQPSTSSVPWPTCTERRRLAFAKNHKVGGDTVKRIFDRYGYVRKLNMVLPRSLVVSGMYPYKLDPKSFLPPPPNQTFDMLQYHTVYERERYREILPKDTVYLTIIREPLSHFKSTWNYYKLQKRFHIKDSGQDPILTFLADPGKYDKKCGHGRHFPYCFTHNAMSADLGFPETTNKRVVPGCDPEERETITREFVQIIEEDFELVMLTQYFDESLVLLKRLMCWSLKDILYFPINTRSYASKETQIPPKLRQNHKEWSYVDYALYDHFNQTFWRRVNSERNDFWGEVRYFRHIKEKMRELCNGYKSSKPCSVSFLYFKDSRWGPGFRLDRNFCMLAKRSLKCHLLLESEHAAKALGLNRSNITNYSDVDFTLFQKAVKSRKTQKSRKRQTEQKTIDVVLDNCAYCNMRNCGPLDYLSHFYHEGDINSDTYHAIVNREHPNFVRQCNIKG
ncbi:galactose-3-O-sulfotransferase 3-like isoform X2 [Branchiostoma floridae x Branchiostoma belcheri]